MSFLRNAVLAAALATFAGEAIAVRPLPLIGDEGRIATCIRSAARGRPWLEKTLWGLRDQEAGWIGAELANTNGTHDLGPLQINSWWVPRIARLLKRPDHHVRHWLRFDPCFNTQAARWIVLAGLSVTGDYWSAVGVYHSPTAFRQRQYAAKVAAHMRNRFGPSVFSVVKIRLRSSSCGESVHQCASRR